MFGCILWPGRNYNVWCQWMVWAKIGNICTDTEHYDVSKTQWYIFLKMITWINHRRSWYGESEEESYLNTNFLRICTLAHFWWNKAMYEKRITKDFFTSLFECGHQWNLGSQIIRIRRSIADKPGSPATSFWVRKLKSNTLGYGIQENYHFKAISKKIHEWYWGRISSLGNWPPFQATRWGTSVVTQVTSNLQLEKNRTSFIWQGQCPWPELDF